MLTTLQATVLFIVEQNGQVSVTDVADRARITPGSARSRLMTLERRNLVSRVYTGHHRGSSYAYRITTAGLAALAAIPEPDEED